MSKRTIYAINYGPTVPMLFVEVVDGLVTLADLPHLEGMTMESLTALCKMTGAVLVTVTQEER